MHLKKTPLKFISNFGLFLALVLGHLSVSAQIQDPRNLQQQQQQQQQPTTLQPQQQQQQQPTLQQPQTEMQPQTRDTTISSPSMASPAMAPAESPLDTMDTDNFQRYKVDGVAAVVGDYLVLESDLVKFRADLENQMADNRNITDCELVGHMMENKLFSHAALQDSTVFQQVPDAQIEAQIDQQIAQLSQQIGSVEKLLAYYRKDSEQELRDELFKINKENMLAEAMQSQIVEEVEITPEEVRTYFNNIPKDERPTFNDEVEIAQIMIKPKVPQKEIDKVVNKLRELKEEIENGSSFNTKAVLYSEDATSQSGGKISMGRKDPYDKDFKEIVFSMREGEISEPFKTAFGYHIVYIENIRGQERDLRHIIMIPRATKKDLDKAKEKTDSIRGLIADGKISFKEAAKKFSDDDESRGDGGQLINPDTGDSRFELTNIDPRMYNEVKRLKEGEVSNVLSDETKTREKFYKLIKVTGLYPEHVADYSEDYTKIKELALQNKQMKIIKEWQEKEIEDTYIKINGDFRECEFQGNWLKK